MLLIIIVSDLCIRTSSSNLDEEYNTGGITHMTKILKYGLVAAVFAAKLGMISSAFAQDVDVLVGGGGAPATSVTEAMDRKDQRDEVDVADGG